MQSLDGGWLQAVCKTCRPLCLQCSATLPVDGAGHHRDGHGRPVGQSVPFGDHQIRGMMPVSVGAAPPPPPLFVMARPAAPPACGYEERMHCCLYQAFYCSASPTLPPRGGGGVPAFSKTVGPPSDGTPHPRWAKSRLVVLRGRAIRGRTVRCARAVRIGGCSPSPVATGPEFCTPDAVLNGSCTLL